MWTVGGKASEDELFACKKNKTFYHKFDSSEDS